MIFFENEDDAFGEKLLLCAIHMFSKMYLAAVRAAIFWP
jgi:hypothetical protein